MQFALHHPDPRTGTERNVLPRRVAAFLVDQLLVFGAMAVLASFALGVGSSVLGALAETGSVEEPLATLLGGTSPGTAVAVGAAVFGVAATLASVAYFTFTEGAAGRTVGKALFGLVVARTDGSPVGYRAAFVRTLLRAVDSAPVLYLLGFGSMLTSDRRQRVGDRVAGTVVVKANTPRSTPDDDAAVTPA